MSRNLRKEFHLEDGRLCVFDSFRFQRVIKDKLQELRENDIRKSRQELLEDIYEATGISASSINHWLMGHHAPNDVDKVKDIADYLNVELDDIMEIENMVKQSATLVKEEMIMGNQDMVQRVEATVVMPKGDNKKDYLDEKSVVRDIYMDMVTYIEEFNNTCGFENDTYGSSYNPYEANEMYEQLVLKIRKAMLDIPFELFNQLILFTDGYLNYFRGDELAFVWDMGTYTEEELIEMGKDISDMNPYWLQFEGYITFCKKAELKEDDWMSKMSYVEIVTEKAYKILQDILKDYLI